MAPISYRSSLFYDGIPKLASTMSVLLWASYHKLQNYTLNTQQLLQPIVLVTVVPVIVHTTSQMQQVIYIGATPLPLIHTFKPSVANCPTRILTVKILTSFAVVAIQWIKKWPPLDMHTTPTHPHTHTHTHSQTSKLTVKIYLRCSCDYSAYRSGCPWAVAYYWRYVQPYIAHPMTESVLTNCLLFSEAHFPCVQLFPVTYTRYVKY